MQSLPRSAESYSRTQRREIAAAVVAVRRQWRRVTTDFDASYAVVEPTLLAIVSTAQERVAAGALAYVPAVLEETGQVVDAVAQPTISRLVGVAGDGRPVDSLLYGAVTHAKTLVGSGTPPTQALRRSGRWLTMATSTVLSDTSRQAESLGMGVQPVTGYVRMLVPPSCSRCAILAGRWYRKSDGFQRHPGCDCRHIPSTEAMAGDITVNPRDYFDSLDPAEQDRIFTKAGAEAIREGADIGQVVNASRGMSRSQSGRMATRDVYGQQLYTTVEGTTRRGRAYRPGAQRLMPESIQAIATDREDYLRLLRLNGYIL